jgi:hypothetical protein
MDGGERVIDRRLRGVFACVNFPEEPPQEK